ncbi:MAG: hypothetical protein V4505_25665 [Pseudomonadota bacterium]
MASTEKNQSKSKESTGRGGARAGAGRKAGSATTKTREIAEKAMAGGLTPLEYMLEIMRTLPTETEDVRLMVAQREMRFEAAKAAAPYIHPRLAAVEHTGPDGGALTVIVKKLTQ